jgi:hypothetical protein
MVEVAGLVNKNHVKEGKDGTPRLNGHMRFSLYNYSPCNHSCVQLLTGTRPGWVN